LRVQSSSIPHEAKEIPCIFTEWLGIDFWIEVSAQFIFLFPRPSFLKGIWFENGAPVALLYQLWMWGITKPVAATQSPNAIFRQTP
jgi:hypothetical protein